MSDPTKRPVRMKINADVILPCDVAHIIRRYLEESNQLYSCEIADIDALRGVRSLKEFE